MDELVAIFRALSDPTRLRIFEFLRQCSREVELNEAGECRPAGACVGDVCCRIDLASSTISHHLKELRHAGLITTERRGRWIYCHVSEAALARLRQFLDEAPGIAGEEETACVP